MNNQTEADYLRERLLLAETRIVQLQRDNDKLRNSLQGLAQEHTTFKNSVKTKRRKTGDYVRTLVWRKCGEKCFYCLNPLPYKSVTIDHVIPLVKGGSNGQFNLVSSCAACNNAKGERMPKEHELDRALKLHEEANKPKGVPVMEAPLLVWQREQEGEISKNIATPPVEVVIGHDPVTAKWKAEASKKFRKVKSKRLNRGASAGMC